MIQEYTGRSRYLPDYDDGSGRLLVAVLCRIEQVTFRALLDTGSPWCMLPAHVAITLGYETEPYRHSVRLSTRLGVIAGRTERIALLLIAEDGTDSEVESTWFLSEDWLGPPVIGWKGCLERTRFALDPTDESFYFGELQG